jgi:O-palmitoleoyl-L-serine hydrolase
MLKYINRSTSITCFCIECKTTIMLVVILSLLVLSQMWSLQLSSQPSATTAQHLDLNCVPKIEILDKDAVCIDGTASAYYFRRGFGSGEHKFHIHFEGGGWCYTPQSCAVRADIPLGSSKDYAPCMQANKNNNGPYLSHLQEENPVLYNFNTIFVRYCDGGSYASDSKALVDGKMLHFKGKSIRDAIVNNLFHLHAMSEATDVLVSGCSAGGLAVLFGIDQIASIIKERAPLARIRGMVDSGFFLEHSHGRRDYDRRAFAYQEALTPNEELDYAYSMREVFRFMNLSAGINEECLAAIPDSPEACVFAERVSRFVKTPLYFIQSKYDSWQVIK